MRWIRTSTRPLGAFLALALIAAVLALCGSAPSAVAVGKVATSACRQGNPHLRTGICFQFPDGRVTWLGNFTSASGRVFFCIDKNKDSRLPASAAQRSTKGLKNQYGKRIGRREVAALNYLIDKWGPDAKATTAAAIGVILRQVMSDTGGQMPAGLSVGEQVRDLRGGLPAPVLAEARAMWREASNLRGPWTLRLTGSLREIKQHESRPLIATVRSAAGHPVPGARVRLRHSGPVQVPTRASTARDGRARFSVRATAAGEVTVTGTVTGPAGNGVLFVPRDRRVQRGWIAERSVDRSRVRGLQVRVEPLTPTVVTATSASVVPAGGSFHDVITVQGLPAGVAATLTARLYGPYPAQPTAADCRPAQLADTRSRRISGSGRFALPATVQRVGGFYVWVASLSATKVTKAVSHPCGIVAETTQVQRNQPTLRTRVSAQRAGVGARLVDSIEITGLLVGEKVPVVWTLYGPVRPNVRGTCTGLRWDDATVHDTGTVIAAGNGTLTTGQTAAVREVGCYSFGERLVATDVVAGVVHPAGLVAQSTLVAKSRPTLRTQVSQQVAVRGAWLRDTVWITGLQAGERVQVQWQLTAAPAVRGGCAGVRWAQALRSGKARVFDRGAFMANGDGRHLTRFSKRIIKPQCYTYSERIAVSATTNGAWHQPGKVPQTALVRKPGRPSVPTGPEGWLRSPSGDRERGTMLSLPTIGKRSVPVRSIRRSRSALALPRDAALVGWWRGSAPLAAATGSSIIAGHVAAADGTPGALHSLAKLKLGDRIVWRGAGRRQVFTVVRRSYTLRTGELPRRIWRLSGVRTLNLITCARKVTYRSGFYHYTHNLTVTARLQEPQRSPG